MYLPFVACAVHDSVYSPVKQSILLFETRNVEGAGGVMHSAALVGPIEAPQVSVLGGTLPLPAPLGAGDAEQVHQLPFSPASYVTSVPLTLMTCHITGSCPSLAAASCTLCLTN